MFLKWVNDGTDYRIYFFSTFFNSLSECYVLLVVGSSCVKSAWQQLLNYYDIILIGASTEIFYLYIFRPRFGFDLFVQHPYYYKAR